MTTLFIIFRVVFIVASIMGSSFAIYILASRHTSDDGARRLEEEVSKFLAAYKNIEGGQPNDR